MNKRILDVGSVVALIALVAFGVFAVAGGLGGGDTKAADTAQEASCLVGAEDCDDTGGTALARCAEDAPDCADTFDGDAPVSICIEGATDCDDTVTNPDGTVSSGDLGDPGECSLVHNIEACQQKAINAAYAALEDMGGPPTRDEVVDASAKAVEWPSACLGVGEDTSLCAQVITPGYIVILDAGVAAYEFHTDLNGYAILAQPGE
ncbi:MAG: hypothetical protein AAB092_06215 [Chloroflexota bacterium]